MPITPEEQKRIDKFIDSLFGSPPNLAGQSEIDEPVDYGMSGLRAALVQDIMNDLDTFNCYSAADVANTAEGLFQYIMTGKVPE